MGTIIEVTDEDIKKGRSRDCRYCPIARAATRALGETVEATPNYLWKQGHCLYTALPEIAKKFIRDFDAGHRVQPFSFSVEEFTP